VEERCEDKGNDGVRVAIVLKHRRMKRGAAGRKKKGKWMRKMMMKAMMLILMRISAGVVARAEQVSPWTGQAGLKE
jgi:hypothetical protein